MRERSEPYIEERGRQSIKCEVMASALIEKRLRRPRSAIMETAGDANRTRVRIAVDKSTRNSNKKDKSATKCESQR